MNRGRRRVFGVSQKKSPVYAVGGAAGFWTEAAGPLPSPRLKLIYPHIPPKSWRSYTRNRRVRGVEKKCRP